MDDFGSQPVQLYIYDMTQVSSQQSLSKQDVTDPNHFSSLGNGGDDVTNAAG